MATDALFSFISFGQGFLCRAYRPLYLPTPAAPQWTRHFVPNNMAVVKGFLLLTFGLTTLILHPNKKKYDHLVAAWLIFLCGQLPFLWLLYFLFNNNCVPEATDPILVLIQWGFIGCFHAAVSYVINFEIYRSVFRLRARE